MSESRKIKVLCTTNNKAAEFQSDAETFGELKIDDNFRDVYSGDCYLRIKGISGSVCSDDSMLPVGEFTAFIKPHKKSDANTTE